MASVATRSKPLATLAELVEGLGGVPLERIRVHPSPGSAIEDDLVAVEAREDRLFELVDGVMVEKPMGYRESVLALYLSELLGPFVRQRNLGVLSDESGMTRLFPGLVRVPDVAFADWARFPDKRLPTDPIPEVVPDLVVEILSPPNTPGEMARKRREYFDATVRLVWEIDRDARTAMVYAAPDSSRTLGPADTLDGGAYCRDSLLPCQFFSPNSTVGQTHVPPTHMVRALNGPARDDYHLNAAADLAPR